MKDIQELSQKGGEKEKGPDDDDHLYQLIRGSPSVIISRGGNEVDYKPQKPKQKTYCEKYNAGSMCSYAYISICMVIHIMH